MKSLVAVVVVLLLVPGAFSAPWFCHELDCPNYKLIKENVTDLGLELRRYEAGKWASTVVEGVQYEKAVAAGFWRLFKYISGDNLGHIKVAMTAPVTVKVTPGPGPTCADNFTISFFVPFAFQAEPPQPSAPEVFISSQPAIDVYVQQFGGWATGATYLQQAADATQALEDAGLAVDSDHFFTAGYDSPFRLTNRHNEVWIPAAKPAAPTAAAAEGGKGKVTSSQQSRRFGGAVAAA